MKSTVLAIVCPVWDNPGWSAENPNGRCSCGVADTPCEHAQWVTGWVSTSDGVQTLHIRLSLGTLTSLDVSQ
jgi:hypothetical protein